MNDSLSAVVLNVIQAAGADVVLSGGKLVINDGTNDLLEEIRLSDAFEYSKTAYAAGTPSVKTYDLTGTSLEANSQYSLNIDIPGRIDFNGGGQEANELIRLREYVVWTGNTAPATVSALVDLLVDRINQDPYSRVTAANNGGDLEITLDDVDEGDFFVNLLTSNFNLTSETLTTPFFAPSGTPEIVEQFAPNQSSATGEYTTYKIDYKKLYKHHAVGGLQAFKDVFVYIFADETAANFAAFETALDAVLDGTHTPVADYLGV